MRLSFSLVRQDTAKGLRFAVLLPAFSFQWHNSESSLHSCRVGSFGRRDYDTPLKREPHRWGRPILELRVLNSYIAWRPFHLLTIRQLLDCIQPGDLYRPDRIHTFTFPSQEIPTSGVSVLPILQSPIWVLWLQAHVPHLWKWHWLHSNIGVRILT